MRARLTLALVAVALYVVMAVGAAPSSAASHKCKGVAVNRITALKQSNTTCADARATAKAWHAACEDISLEFFCDPKSLKLRKEPPAIKARGYKCVATEVSRTPTKARHRVLCKKGKKRVSFKHMTTRSS